MCARGCHFEILHGDECFFASVAPWSAALALFVGCQVEGDKEKQVGAQDDQAGDRGKLLTGAVADVGPVWEIRGREVRV